MDSDIKARIAIIVRSHMDHVLNELDHIIETIEERESDGRTANELEVIEEAQGSLQDATEELLRIAREG